MADGLLASVLDAHGGLDTWRRFTRVEATIVSGGLMFEMKGQPHDPTPRRMSVALQREWGSVHPFGDDSSTRRGIRCSGPTSMATRCGPT
jgi:hypothetical protein